MGGGGWIGLEAGVEGLDLVGGENGLEYEGVADVVNGFGLALVRTVGEVELKSVLPRFGSGDF